ncbi:MAG TPA: UxaA family hydrolase, partial [Geminicoccus sp.]|nr:UxaA family hydrolase [Geminicoccus sp.]
MEDAGMGEAAWAAVVIHPDDDVAVALRPLAPGRVRVRSGGRTIELEVAQEVPLGHKLALRDLPAGTIIRKYGEAIGALTEAVGRGGHVHVHNLRSRRA